MRPSGRPTNWQKSLFGSDYDKTAPGPSQVEITVIGPSFGECICVHPGGGRWWIIDSCWNRERKSPAPLDYLRELGVQPERQVDLVLTTHWHDDHTGGLLDLLTACSSARFCLSAALTKREFLTILTTYGSRPPALVGSMVRELNGVINYLQESGRERRTAIQGKTLIRLEDTSSGHGHSCSLVALSPSDFSEQTFIEHISALLPSHLTPKRPMVSLSPNEASVALWIEIGPLRALLGADLENTADERGGWKAYLAADNCPPGKAALFKIPHHGSENGHNEQLWTDRLEVKPATVTTPWVLGGRSLPKPEDAARVRALSGAAFITANPKAARGPRRHSAVAKHLRESDIVLRTVPVGNGGVRFRTAPVMRDGPWCVELLGSAGEL